MTVPQGWNQDDAIVDYEAAKAAALAAMPTFQSGRGRSGNSAAPGSFTAAQLPSRPAFPRQSPLAGNGVDADLEQRALRQARFGRSAGTPERVPSRAVSPSRPSPQMRGGDEDGDDGGECRGAHASQYGQVWGL